jgi:hypothetical protein
MQEIVDAIVGAVSDLINSIADFLPSLIAAIIIFLIGVLIAAILRNLLVRVLNAINFERLLANTGIPEALKKADSKLTVTAVLGELVRWVTVLVFLVPAINRLGLSQLDTILRGLINYIPNVIAAVIIITVGAILAKLAKDFVTVSATPVGPQTAKVIGQTARWAIIVFATLAALSQLGVARNLIEILFTGFVAMVAIAGGLAFGLGGQGTASEFLKKLKDDLGSKK